MADDVETLAAAVLRSARYRAVDADLVRRIGARKIAAHRNLKEAIKETKNTLHQVYGAFLPGVPRYSLWLDELHAAADAQSDLPVLARPEFRRACAKVMAGHASTAERLPYLQDFYAATLAGVESITTILDIGCGLNPLALPWMHIQPDAQYRCHDIDTAAAAFLNAFFALSGTAGRAVVWDAAAAVPPEQADLALVLKVLPVLDTVDRDAGVTLLRGLRARHLLVSFPTRSLGGRDRGMTRAYGDRFTALAASEGWILQRFEFPTELAFLVEKPCGQVPL